MCGFAGVVAWDDAFRVDRAILERMSARIAHRGPDGEGTYFNHTHAIDPHRPQCALAHRRLAILDLDPRSLQPFSDPSGRYWLVFNGEIYNFRELRAQLSAGREWRTTGDTEVLLAAYEVWGARCLDHLNGMYALAIWDEQEKSLFLARDRMGQKPLYLAWAPDRRAVAFASELPALRALPWFDARVDRAGLGEYLHRGYIGAPRTIFLGAEKLPPAHWMRVTRDKVEARRYFDPNDVLAGDGHLAAAGESLPRATRRLVIQAVQRQLVADVPLGCFLSGGIDSSAIASAMKWIVPDGQPVMTFSIGFDDPRYDETRYAAIVARHLGTQHHKFIVRPDAVADLPTIAGVFGEPFADSSALPTHYLARETRKFVKVALSGDGGDELYGGYDRYRAMRLGEQLCRIPGVSQLAAAKTIWQRIQVADPKSTAARFKRLLESLDQATDRRYATYMSLMDDPTVQRIMPDLPPDNQTRVLYSSFLQDRDVVQAALATDRVSYLPDDLLAKVDRCSMIHALEVRSPFMDHDLVNFAAALSSKQLLAGGAKRLLREAFAEQLPAEILGRGKMGFAVPIGEWFCSSLKEMLRDNLFAADSFAAAHFNRAEIERLITEHDQRRADHTQRLYALLMLELWSRT